MEINFHQRKFIIKDSKKLINNQKLFNIYNYSIGNNFDPLHNKITNNTGNIILETKKKIINENNIGKLIYQIDENKNKTKIFDKKFVLKNNKKAKIIIYNKLYNLNEKTNNKDKKDFLFIVKIKLLENMINIESIFEKCEMLYFVDISRLNPKYLKKINRLFYGCTSLLSINGLYNWNIINISNISEIFYDCSLLEYLPDISKWNTKNIK